MKCPHCYRPTHVRSSHTHVGLVVRIRECTICRRRYRTEEKHVSEIAIKGKQADAAKRRAERQLWHEHKA